MSQKDFSFQEKDLKKKITLQYFLQALQEMDEHRTVCVDSRLTTFSDNETTTILPAGSLVAISQRVTNATDFMRSVSGSGKGGEFSLGAALYASMLCLERKALDGTAFQSFVVPLVSSLEKPISMRLYVGINFDNELLLHLLEGSPKFSFITKRGYLLKK